MNMNRIQLFIISALVAVPLFLIDWKLGLVYTLLWFDKVPLGILSIPRLIGIEFTTISTLLLGMLYGPLGALFIFIAVPLLDGVKHQFVPSDSSWPPFVPGFANIVDAILVMTAFILAGFDVLLVLVAVLLIKYAIHEAKDMIYGQKPFDIMIVPNFIFNVVIVLLLKDVIMSLI